MGTESTWCLLPCQSWLSPEWGVSFLCTERGEARWVSSWISLVGKILPGPGPSLPEPPRPRTTPTTQAILPALRLGSSYLFQWDHLRLREVAGSSLRLHRLREWNQGQGSGQAAPLCGRCGGGDRGWGRGVQKELTGSDLTAGGAEVVQAGTGGESREGRWRAGVVQAKGVKRETMTPYPRIFLLSLVAVLGAQDRAWSLRQPGMG